MSRSYGAGGFSDQYDNQRLRSLDRDQHPGGVTGIPFEDDIDLNDMDFFPRHGERYVEKTSSRETDLNFNYERVLEDHTGKGPKNWNISDEKLKDKVSEVLLHSIEVDPSEIEITVQERIVTLKGSILSKGMKRLALDLVESIPGVEDVFLELKILDKG